MHRSLAALPLLALAWASAAHAGTEPLYAPAPEWVDSVELAELELDGTAANLLRDWQYRIEDGVVYAYSDSAIRVDNPQALMAANTQTLAWLPDKGDLTVHRFEIIRDGEVIDLIAQGVTFEVLRREQGLENRLLDGELTATVSVPGLHEGDVLRIAHSVSTADQALGDEVQALQFLPSAPWQVGTARVAMSWPVDEEMYWDAEDRAELGEPVERDGYRYLSLDLPLAEPDPLPGDAPFRYRRPAVLRVGSFATWDELSAVMAPHYEAGAALAADSPVAAQAAEIMAATDDPLARAAMAVRLVQDEVSYLLNGLDGGNYLPQSAEETWNIRYGDCKAKSVLLLALLRAMDIEAEPVLVSTRMGDAVPELLPLPAAFDHVIIRAVIDGTDYWLDGTSAATRLATIGDVPPFYHALPLREGGAGLIAMTPRDPAVPQMTMTMRADHSAGVDFPQLFTLEMRVVGAAGAQLQAVVDADDPETLRQMAAQFSEQDEMQVSSLSIAYDEEEAVATLIVHGIAPSDFEWEDGRLRTVLNSAQDFSSFNPDRARPSWRDIPVATAGPLRQASAMTMVLPQGGLGFSLAGNSDFAGGFGNTRITREVAIEGDTVRAVSEVFSTLGEISATELPAAKRAARRLESDSLELVPPSDVTWRWELSADERQARAAPIFAAYQDAIEFADEDNHLPRMYRALFARSVFDLDAALADFDYLAEEIPSEWVFTQRSWLNEARGDIEAAIADLQAAYDLEPSNANARALASMQAENGQVQAAMELLDVLAVGEDDLPYHTDALATVMALGGDVSGGHALIEDLVADQPQNATALNGDCWFRGLFQVALESALARCTQAVERASNPAAALDSRALIHFRLGDYSAALADLDAVLEVQPDLAESHYLRGIVRLHADDAGGREDMATGLLMAPQMEQFYTRHGILPPSS
ncbi:MAG: DUF3857 domain-containing protein [Erythrobacter sp.]|nr:MAG: DUF3857 domain-containing protein [Erythrobacter sp.]